MYFFMKRVGPILVGREIFALFKRLDHGSHTDGNGVSRGGAGRGGGENGC
jgi:hypothetical protein